jgi:alpha-L-arabinofuranosidase
LLFSDFAGAKPVKTELTTPSEHAPRVLPDIKNTSGEASFGVVDGLAALGPKGELLLSFVHRGASGPVRLHVRVDDFSQGRKVQIHTLSGTMPWAANTLENPKAVEPIRTGAELREGSMTLVLPPFSVVQARINSEH